MLFNSYLFLFVFLPVVVLATMVAARVSRDVTLVVVGVASLIFYGYWNPIYVPLMLLSIGGNYALSKQIRKAEAAQKKRLLAVGVAANLGALAYFKYANFFVDNWNTWTGAEIDMAHVALPLAISFFTFQQIAFLVDDSRGQVPPTTLLRYGVFVTFFPQLIAGPIVSHQELIPQLDKAKAFLFRHKDMALGLTLFALGLFKKVVLADALAPFANDVFNAADAGRYNPTLFEAWGGTLSYTFQLYFDFSGYSDMAIGLGRVFGLRLPQNFHSPYKSTSVVEFWRRWHMTLSRFLRDYLYFSLGGNRSGPVRRYVNLLITMLLGGLWHGAGWNFLFWGGLHGSYLIINHGLRRVLPKRTSSAWRFAGWLATFAAVMLGWVFFRATSVSGAVAILNGMMGANGVYIPQSLLDASAGVGQSLMALGVDGSAIGARWFGREFGTMALWVFGAGVVALVFPNTQEFMRSVRPSHRGGGLFKAIAQLRFHLRLRYALGIGVLSTWALMRLSGESEFLYYTF